jgi:hypothetical protein
MIKSLDAKEVKKKLRLTRSTKNRPGYHNNLYVMCHTQHKKTLHKNNNTVVDCARSFYTVT